MSDAALERLPTLKIVIVGHVDHGKSTLIGRLLHDTDSLPDGKVASIKAMSERRGMPFEFAFLLDALQAERDQGITIDTTQIWLRTPERDVVIIDAPGHKEFLRNMVTGAAQADAAVLVIDAAEGVREQSRRHGYLLHLLGVQQVVVAVNKMDMVGYDGARFQTVRAEIVDYLTKLGVNAAEIVPLSARQGDNVVAGSTHMPWYRGPTLVQTLAGMRTAKPATELPLRLPVQDVYKFDERRIIAGRIESGRLKVGDTLVFSPVNNRAKVASIEAWPVPAVPIMEASAGQSVGITLDEQIFIERGAVASLEQHAPVETDVFRGRLFWLAHEALQPNAILTMKIGTAKVQAYVQSIERVIDATDLTAKPAQRVERNEIAEVTIRARRMLALDPYSAMPRLGRFVIVDQKGICGGGIISMEGYADQRRALTRRGTNLQRVEMRISDAQRALRNGHRGGVVWLTGLSGAGKSTLAIEAEKRLFDAGYQVCVLDGDNIRDGLNADLTFSPEDRAENIRRVGEVAALMAKTGLVVLTAFISPYRSDRARARQAAGENFREVFVAADLAVCERRDPKGLYAKARAGQIKQFTGIDAPYEAPEQPDFTVQSGVEDIDASARKLVDYIRGQFTHS